ncbi:MAG: HlyC/CorC family transporter [Armatimonadetes bacterium]|nr:HlyC/CorC family transporter [Armatimonadota bacterium]
MSDVILPLILIALLVLFNGLFVASEFAILAAPRARMEYLAEQGNRAARAMHRVQDDQRLQDAYIATAQIGISAASVGLGMYAEHKVADWILPLLHHMGWFQVAAAHSVATVVAISVLTYFHVVIGEMAPKSLALFFPEQTALMVSLPMSWTQRLLYPLVALLNGIGNLLLRALRIPSATGFAHVHSPEELEMIVEESHETGVLGEEESEILVNLLHFSDLQVRKVMVPRTSVVGIEYDSPVPEIVKTVIESRHTRYPVCQDGLDHIVGILHVKELFREIHRNADNPSIDRMLRKPVFVPEQMTVEDLLVEFRNHHSQVAVVIDEYGGTSGLVSLEDVLEEIFGEVQDEFDEESPTLQIIDTRSASVDGRLRLDEFTEEFGLDLERPDVDTIGGLVQAELGRPAIVGDSVTVQGAQLVVTELEGLAVGKLYVLLPDDSMDDPGSSDQGR